MGIAVNLLPHYLTNHCRTSLYIHQQQKVKWRHHETAKRKTPHDKGAHLRTILFGPMADIPDSIYQQIKDEIVWDTAPWTNGSDVYVNGFRRLFTWKSFEKSGTVLCAAIATLARHIDPLSMETIIANPLIHVWQRRTGRGPDDRNWRCMRRIILKCVMRVTRHDVINASGSLQVCAGLKSGSEAAIYKMHSIFEADEKNALLLLDVANHLMQRTEQLRNRVLEYSVPP